jgi:hypothetical protein
MQDKKIIYIKMVIKFSLKNVSFDKKYLMVVVFGFKLIKKYISVWKDLWSKFDFLLFTSYFCNFMKPLYYLFFFVRLSLFLTFFFARLTVEEDRETSARSAEKILSASRRRSLFINLSGAMNREEMEHDPHQHKRAHYS